MSICYVLWQNIGNLLHAAVSRVVEIVRRYYNNVFLAATAEGGKFYLMSLATGKHPL